MVTLEYRVILSFVKMLKFHDLNISIKWKHSCFNRDFKIELQVIPAMPV